MQDCLEYNEKFFFCPALLYAPRIFADPNCFLKNFNGTATYARTIGEIGFRRRLPNSADTALNDATTPHGHEPRPSYSPCPCVMYCNGVVSCNVL
jgi:hypothetical protein